MNLPSLNGNWIDLIILAVLIFFISEAWRFGFWVILADFLGFLFSLLIALRGYSIVAGLLRANFTLPQSIANAIGFMVAASFSEAIIGFIFAEFIRKIPYKFWKKPWNNIAAIIPALGQGLVMVAFILTLVMGLPIRPQIKKDIADSKIGGALVKQTSRLEASMQNIFGGLLEDALTYRIAKPGSEESIPIDVTVEELKVDQIAEEEMFKLVNQERKSRGIKELSVRQELVPIAEDYAKDMWTRKYFGHYSPEGETVSDRLTKNDIKFMVVGENLAWAPTLQTAHTGLMNSEGHKRNILDPEFKRVGFGVIDNGYYGKMFVQIFTD